MRSVILFCFFLASHFSLAGEEKFEQDASGRLVPQVVNGKIDPAVLTLEQAISDQKTEFRVSSEKPFSVYAGEYLLAAQVRSFRWSADSLSSVSKGSARLVFFRQHRAPLILIQTSFKPVDLLDPILRKKSGSMNFTILSGSLLLIFFSVAMAGLSRSVRPATEIMSIFSLNFREDRSDDAKINSSASLLRFIIITLFASVILTIVRRQGDGSTGYYFGVWGSNLIFLILFFGAKAVLTVFWAWIFNLKEAANHQATGFFKTVLFISAGAGGFLLLNFIAGDFRELNFFILYIFTPLILTGYCLTLFLRLIRISAASPLHLFSYLCISEFIPLVLLVFTI
jgi:hypothetical protein